jgi:cell division protein FtsQ
VTVTEAPPGAGTAGGERPRIDPRLRARRIAVKRQEGRRRLRWAVVLGVLVALAAAVVFLARSPLLAIDDVTVSGVVYADAGAIDEVVDDAVGESLLTIDTGALAERFEAIPWVKRAEVRRAWPPGIVVDLSERRPLAAYYAPDRRYRVIDSDGVVLATVDGNPIDLVGIGGIGPAVAPGDTVPEAYRGAAAVIAAFPDELRARVAAVGLDDDGNLTLALAPAGEVLLGPPDEVRAKLVAVLTLLRGVDPASVGRLDVRVPDKPVLTTTPS